MYADIVKKYRSSFPLKVKAVECPDYGVTFYLKQLNAGEKMHLYYVFENDLRNAPETEKLLYALNISLCNKDGERTENVDDYRYLADLPNAVLQQLLEANTELLSLTDEVKKSSEQITGN